MSKPCIETLKLSCRKKHIKYRATNFDHSKKISAPDEFIRLDPWEAEYLYTIAAMSRSGIVETGRFYGGSTLLLSCATDAPVYSFDIEPQDDSYLEELLAYHEIDNCNLYIEDSQKNDRSEQLKYDMLFVDGDHSYDGCYNDLANWWDNLEIGGHIIVHDSYPVYNIPQAISNFTLDKNIRVHVSPFNTMNTWDSRWGSICHFQKLG